MLKIFKSNKFLKYLTPITGGIIGGISISSYLWLIFMPISISILWSGFDKKYSNFLWGFSLVLISHYWLLYLHPLTWLGFSWISSILISNIILFFCALIGGFYVSLWGLVGSKLMAKEHIFSKKETSIFMKVALISLLWAFGEVTLSQTPFLWIGIGESLIPGDLYLAGLARLIGSPGVCFISILWGFWIFFIFEKWKRKLNYKKVFISGISILVFLHLIGGHLIQSKPRESLYPISVWQTNIPTREKLSRDYQKTNDQILGEQEKALNMDAKLLVAPEGTLKTNFVLLSPSKIDTLIGGFRKEKNTIRNSLLAFKAGDNYYSDFIDKYRLVPFGERIPKMFSKFFFTLSSLGSIEPGNYSRYFEWKNSPPFAAVICYEITDGLQIRNAVREGSKFILAIANLDPYPPRIFDQYLSLIRMRSIENNIDSIIASNTGPSGLIRNDGRIDQLLESEAEKNEVFNLNLLDKTTFYNHYGLIPLIITFFSIYIYLCLFEKH